MFNPHGSAGVNAEPGSGRERQTAHHHWNLESICKMAQLDSMHIIRRIKDGYKGLGFDTVMMLCQGQADVQIIGVFPLRVLMRWEMQGMTTTFTLKNSWGDFST